MISVIIKLYSFLQIFNEFQLIKSLSFGIQPSQEINLGSSYLMSTKNEIILLFPKLKTLDLGENPYLKCICPSLLHLINLQYLSLDCCIKLCEVKLLFVFLVFFYYYCRCCDLYLFGRMPTTFIPHDHRETHFLFEDTLQLSIDYLS